MSHVRANQAVKTIDPKKATGKLHKLWMDFAKFYEGHGDVANARVIFEKATLVPYKRVLCVCMCVYVCIVFFSVARVNRLTNERTSAFSSVFCRFVCVVLYCCTFGT